MSAPLELIVLVWSVYPRRILIYLSGKGLSSSPLIKVTPCATTQRGITFPTGMPPGTVPMLKLPDGTYIKQSLAILDYLEDICDRPNSEVAWQEQLARSAENSGSMRDTTAQKRARTRDMLSLIHETKSFFGFACHKGSQLFAAAETPNALAAKLALEFCAKNLKVLDQYYANVETLNKGGPVTIAGFVLYSMLCFSKEFYGIDLVPDFSNLASFYESFGNRESAKVEQDHFPEQIRELAR